MSSSGPTVFAFLVALGAAVVPVIAQAAGPSATMPAPPQRPAPTPQQPRVTTPPPPSSNPGCGDPQPGFKPTAPGHH
jgi:hypothetical protein